MSHPLVSIVIPVYNGERFVADAIRSALAQTWENKEVIVIDDGSTDGTLDVLKSFGDAIRWETGPNRGGCAARNRGVEIARGELIQFLDSDDLLHPEKLERQVPEVLKDEGTLIYCDFVTQDLRSAQYLGLARRPNSETDPVCFALKAQRLDTASVIHFIKNLKACGGFDRSLACAQEYELHVRLASEGFLFKRLPQVLYVSRYRSDGVSSLNIEVIKQHLGIVQQAHSHLLKTGTITDRRARTLAGVLASDSRLLIRSGEMETARLYREEARRIHPDGGLDQAYKGSTRLLSRLLGLRLTESVVDWKRNYGRNKVILKADGDLIKEQEVRKHSQDA